jgi:uncharacterized protein YegP (UPF0339 family)
MPATVKTVDKPKGLRLEIYIDGGKQYRWRKVAANGEIISIAGEGFGKSRGAKAYAIKAARREHPHLPLFDLTVGK